MTYFEGKQYKSRQKLYTSILLYCLILFLFWLWPCVPIALDHTLILVIDVSQSSMKRTPNSMRSQTTSEISASGNKTLRHTLTGHYSTSGRIASENSQSENKVCITHCFRTSLKKYQSWFVKSMLRKGDKKFHEVKRCISIDEQSAVKMHSVLMLAVQRNV